MSHLSTIKTKLCKRDFLVQALDNLEYSPIERVPLTQGIVNQPESVVLDTAQLPCGDIEFRWNVEDSVYELVTDLDKWQLPFPVERFIAQLTQRYALCNIFASSMTEGFQVKEQIQTKQGSIELLLTKWEA
uniref:Uncharacterized protein ycf35 n=1 Tax=Paulinella chromatophora TaxID=39717 RepID=B1X3W4_PAUCH|nr:hypothetical protein PCC_0183 [Paulinella chromatophora]ACB42633.1 hypothetical protein PCC_0183 [Paulinella chromatophora]